MTPPYSMYYIVRFWGKLKSLRKYMHFNIFERSNIFNIFLTFSIQILTFPFNNCFFAISKKMKCCRPPSFSSTIMGRSWADHGQIMGRPWAIDSCRKILKISAFSDTVFLPKNYENLRFSHSPWTKRLVIFADPVSMIILQRAYSRNIDHGCVGT